MQVRLDSGFEDETIRVKRNAVADGRGKGREAVPWFVPGHAALDPGHNE